MTKISRVFVWACWALWFAGVGYMFFKPTPKVTVPETPTPKVRMETDGTNTSWHTVAAKPYLHQVLRRAVAGDTVYVYSGPSSWTNEISTYKQVVPGGGK